MTKSQKRIFDRINSSEKWSCSVFDSTWPNGIICLKFENNSKNVFTDQSGLIVVGKKGGCKIISMSVFATSRDKKFERTCANLFCYDVFGYGHHPKIKIR